MSTSSRTPAGGSGYWYPDEHADQADVTTEGPQPPGAVALLLELREYCDSNLRMRARIREKMDLGEKDMTALRAVIRSHTEGRVLRQRELAALLDISPASVSVLVDRLERAGHVERTVHPDDRRSTAVVPTPHADTEVRTTLHPVHARMFEVAQSLSPDDRAVVMHFLRRLNHDQDHDPDPDQDRSL
jgi:DNA-binding MarR family transcriptional regulator